MMKKLILILLLLATIAVARWYFEPQDPATNKIATVKNIDVKNIIAERNGGEGAAEGEVKEDSVEEEVVEAILPGKVVATVQDGLVDDTTLPTGGDTYSLSEGSSLHWVGKKIGGQHDGVISIVEGDLQVDGSRILGGSFTMDMTSIRATDIDSPKLDDTIKEWFNVAEYPQSTFTIVEATPTTVVGIMNINNISKEISFPATVIVEGDTVIATAEFALDRNEWDVAGGTPAVSEFMELDFSLTWKK